MYGTTLTDYCRVLWPATIAFAALLDETKAQWPQWGGPNRNFTVEAKGLAEKWPQDGPKKLWKRELGDGYSSIVVDEGLLYTMYRAGSEEASVALDILTGQTVWEHRNPSPYDPGMDAEIGRGPNSTPLVSANRIFTIGAHSVIHCFDKRTGKILWRRDLVDELGARLFRYGYASSPLVYKELLIVAVDRPRPKSVEHGQEGNVEAAEARSAGRARTLMALDQRSGETVWSSQDFMVDHSSPILINLRGEDQIVLYLNEGIMAVAPDSGRLLWHYKVEQHGHDMTPLWLDGDVLVACSPARCRALQLARRDGRTAAEELWMTRKTRFPMHTPVAVGDYILGISGSFEGQAAAKMIAIEAKTGKLAWAERGFNLASCVYADGKLIILDVNGRLTLATPTSEGLTVHSQCNVTERYSLSAPALVGTTLYVRDRKHIMALDLGG